MEAEPVVMNKIIMDKILGTQLNSM